MATKRRLLNIKEHGKTAGYASPDEVNTVYNNIIVAQREVEKWIALQFKDIDLTKKDPENLERIRQRKLIVKDRWNEWDGKKFVNRPTSMQHLGKTVRGKHTAGTRFNQLLIRALAWKGVDTSEKKLGGIGDPYETIEKLVGFQTKIESLGRTRYGKDVNQNALADLGMTVSQPFNKESNIYYMGQLDQSNTTKDLEVKRKARLDFKSNNPSLYAANPGAYLGSLPEDNQFFAIPEVKSGTPSPYNYRKPNTKNPYDVDIQQADGSYKRATSIQRDLLKAGFKPQELTDLMIHDKEWRAARRR